MWSVAFEIRMLSAVSGITGSATVFKIYVNQFSQFYYNIQVNSQIK